MYTELDLLKLYDDASFYDAEFSKRDHEIEFYREVCSEFRNVLEVACGTGRITIPLAQSGVFIEGKDISSEMIAKARLNALKKGLDVDFVVEDARCTTGQYDLIFMATNAFQHFINFNDALKCLKAFQQSLLPAGRIIIDIQVPNIKKLSREHEETRPYKYFNYRGKKVNANIQGRYDNLTQVYGFDIRYICDDEILKEKKVAMRMFYPQEAALLFSEAGFTVEKAYGNYEFEELNKFSEKQIYILQKRENVE